MYLSVVIPAYNEEKRLPKTLKEISSYLEKQNYDYEIIVVNDGSKDKTAEIIKELISEIKNLKLIDNKENCGKGFVVRQGLLEAKGEYRLFTDADNSTPISEIEKFFPYFKKGYDIVIGSRDIKGAIIKNPQPLYRRILGDIFSLLSRIIVGYWGIKDSQCGFKAFTAKAANDILPKCRINRFAFDPEIIKLAKKMNYKIKEVPIIWENEPHTKVDFKNTIKMGIDLLIIKWNLLTGKYKI